MKTLRSSFISSNISVHQRREEQWVMHGWIVKLLGLASSAGVLSEWREQGDAKQMGYCPISPFVNVHVTSQHSGMTDVTTLTFHFLWYRWTWQVFIMPHVYLVQVGDKIELGMDFPSQNSTQSVWQVAMGSDHSDNHLENTSVCWFVLRHSPQPAHTWGALDQQSPPLIFTGLHVWVLRNIKNGLKSTYTAWPFVPELCVLPGAIWNVDSRLLLGLRSERHSYSWISISNWADGCCLMIL